MKRLAPGARISGVGGWWNGRHIGLKIQWGASPVGVRIPSRPSLRIPNLSPHDAPSRRGKGQDVIIAGFLQITLRRQLLDHCPGDVHVREEE